MKRIGLLSDTHGYWDSRYLKYFDSCDEIWHAGDIGYMEIADKLQLPQMVEQNTEGMKTAFTVSIDAAEKYGVTTGISAFDRAKTIEVALAHDAVPSDLNRPGHLFPCVARRGGVLQRTGHTEAVVDLARLCGHTPAGPMCEIMDDDGHMMRRDNLSKFAD